MFKFLFKKLLFRNSYFVSTPIFETANELTTKYMDSHPEADRKQVFNFYVIKLNRKVM